MYIAIDIGGTKTLVCVLTNEGVIREEIKFPTPKTYTAWLDELSNALDSFEHKRFKGGCVAAPGTINRKEELVKNLGNLPWKDLHIARDVARLTQCPFVMENDAKLAGLSESMVRKHRYSRVLYMTLSTGIGIGLTENGKINTAIGDGGGKAMIVEHKGKMVPWEDFASGSAIVRTYGKMASEIEDRDTWKAISRNLVPGILELIAVLQPEVLVMGGGAGRYLPKFQNELESELKKYESPLLTIPPLEVAERPDEAVIYGCYDYAKQHFA